MEFKSQVYIHPTAKIGKNVDIGSHSWIGPHVEIGDHTRIGNCCILGGPPEHRDHWDTVGKGVRIGSGCFISNLVTIDSGTVRKTQLGDRVTMLRGSHAGHDAILEDECNVSCNVLIGGHCIIMQSANLGLGAIIHQNVVVGPLAMIGMGAICCKKTPINPYWVYVGNPAKPLRANTIGIERSQLSDKALEKLSERYKELTACPTIKKSRKKR